MAAEAKQEDKKEAEAALKFTETNSIVIDNGTGKIKAGHGGDDLPRVCMPTMIGRSKEKEKSDNIFYGYSAYLKQNALDCSYPMQHQLVNNWEDMELLWNHILTKRLKIKPSEQDILVTAAPFNPKASSEKMTQIFFEKFNVAKFYIAVKEVLALYASGRKSGVVLDCGHALSHSVPVVDGYAVPDGIQRLDVAGDAINKYLGDLLTDKMDEKQQAMQTQIIKERFAYIALDFKEELKTCGEEKYLLPDGKVINIGSERLQCAETLFKPDLIGEDGNLSIAKIVNESISKCDETKREMLYKNIVLSGGTTFLTGFRQRLQKEVNILAPKDTIVNIIQPTQRAYSAWIGGSILVSLDAFQSMYVTKAEYDENGAQIVHKKCC